MTTIRHKATGQTLEGEIAFRDHLGFQAKMGGVFTWFDSAHWEILTEPRPLPTHEGAVIRFGDVVYVRANDFLCPEDDLWETLRGAWYSLEQLAEIVGNEWVELVEKEES